MLKLADNPPMIPDGFTSLTEVAGDWWVAHTKSRSEKALAWELMRTSIPHFLPMMEKTMMWGGRKRKVLMPIFPSYVFFSGSGQDRYRVMTTDRVCQVIPVQQREQFVKEIETIRIALGSRKTLDLYPFAAVGNLCRVAKGPLQGIEGVVVRKDDLLRLVLQVSMLGQGASLEITADLLEPA